MNTPNLVLKSREVIIGSNDKTTVKIGGDNPTRIVVPFGISSKKDLNVDYFNHLHQLERNGADIFQELSVFGDYSEMRKDLIQNVNIPYGTVLAYEFWDNCKRYKSLTQASMHDILIETLLCQIEHGVDYITIHSSLSDHLLAENKYSLEQRVISCPSRAGAILKELMIKHGVDNPLNYSFSEIAELCYSSNVVVSLGASFRPAAIADALDMVHINEIKAQGALIKSISNKPGFLIEGLSHAVPEDIMTYRKLCHDICDRYPVTALGPLTIDNGAGMDDVAASIGLVFAINAGISSVNLITRKEHLAMPETQDTLDALNAFKVSIEVARVMQEGKFSEKNILLSKAREQLDWEDQKNHLLFPDVIDKYIEPNGKKNQPCKICNFACPFLRKDDINHSIPRWIFPYWKKTICEINVFLEKNKNTFISAYTFGSLMNGDFVGSKYDGEIIPFSDFEFTFISKSDISEETYFELQKVKSELESSELFEIAKPLFHIDIRVISIDQFKAYDSSTFFWHHLTVNGKTLWGKDLLSQSKNMKLPKISSSDLFSKVTSLLIEFMLVIKPVEHIKQHRANIYNKKIIHSLATIGCKIGLFYAASIVGTAPKNVNAALEIIKFHNVNLYKRVKQNYNIRNNTLTCDSIVELSVQIKELIFLYINHFYSLPNNTLEELNNLDTNSYNNSSKIKLFKSTMNLFFKFDFTEDLSLSDEWWLDRLSFYENVLSDLRNNDKSFEKRYAYSENHE